MRQHSTPNILGIIPARYASTRFPGKPLVEIHGKSMIQRVYEQCKKASLLTEVIVATDDSRIFEHVLYIGGKVIMTASHHLSGTDRVGEVAMQMPDYEFYINIQGDEPFIAPAAIDILCEKMISKQAPIATLIKAITNLESLANPHIVKVVKSNQDYALYFSRSAIPFLRNIQENENPLSQHTFFQHIGIYGFSKTAIQEIVHLAPSSLELTESLEQLRWLENGYKILTALTDYETIAIDSPADLARCLILLEKK